ncbi:hypothetical protein O181_112930 [Austropuccinia psidii MF-1]|uniref:Uncharacterized protein n=1 Tax=Austropuccinia psidii MF-1 TaxID=1389203 RepID=A0A9Q3PU07_9BASI|nr:hypothetical protein [Austropuccinia psidii MF-1]
MSENRTKDKVATTAWWPQWKAELSEYIKMFEIFQKENRKHGKNSGLLQNLEEPKHPWETIHMDCVTGIVLGGKENFISYLVIGDRYRKSAWCPKCCKEDTAIDPELSLWNNTIAIF